MRSGTRHAPPAVSPPQVEAAEATTDPTSHTTTTFEFECLDDDTRTLVAITEGHHVECLNVT